MTSVYTSVSSDTCPRPTTDRGRAEVGDGDGRIDVLLAVQRDRNLGFGRIVSLEKEAPHFFVKRRSSNKLRLVRQIQQQNQGSS